MYWQEFEPRTLLGNSLRSYLLDFITTLICIILNFRFRREVGVGEAEEKTLISTPASIKMDELVRVLEQEIDVDEVSVIEWTREGHSVSDFWKLLNIYDKDGECQCCYSIPLLPLKKVY